MILMHIRKKSKWTRCSIWSMMSMRTDVVSMQFGGTLGLIAAKVLAGPILLAASTYALHKWGTILGGLLVGLPLVSGPISALLLAQYGPSFAVRAAYGTLTGLAAAGAFCACYALAARRASWRLSLAAAYCGFFATAGGLSLIDVHAVWLVVVTTAAFCSLVLFIGPAAEELPSTLPRKRTLLFRMAIAGLTVVAVTGLAHVAGPEVAGLLAPLPVIAAIMAVSSHRSGGAYAVHGVLHGTVAGLVGGAAFFSIVVLLVGHAGPAITYLAATLGALLVGAVFARVPAIAPHRLARHPFTVKALGQMSESTQTPHAGRLASHTARPWSISL